MANDAPMYSSCNTRRFTSLAESCSSSIKSIESFPQCQIVICFCSSTSSSTTTYQSRTCIGQSLCVWPIHTGVATARRPVTGHTAMAFTGDTGSSELSLYKPNSPIMRQRNDTTRYVTPLFPAIQPTSQPASQPASQPEREREMRRTTATPPANLAIRWNDWMVGIAGRSFTLSQISSIKVDGVGGWDGWCLHAPLVWRQ